MAWNYKKTTCCQRCIAYKFTPESLEATATVSLDDGTITSSNIVLTAKVPGIDAAKFKECADDAKANCPISKLLNTTIGLEAKLV